MKTFLRVTKAAMVGWWNDRALSLGAAISFYALFSLAPVLLASVTIAGLFFGQDAARLAVVDEAGGLIGADAAAALDSMLSAAKQFGTGPLSLLFGIAMFFILATGAIVELQDDLNIIFRSQPEGGNVWVMIKSRLISAALVLTLGFLLLISLVLDAGLTALSSYLLDRFEDMRPFIVVLNVLFAWLIASTMFALIFRLLPEKRLEWHTVIVGAALTGALIEIGKFLIGLYIGRSGITSTYGSAASLVTILLWIFYTCQIFLFGAEFTWAYARERGTSDGETRAHADPG
ncbi:YihY/virulence factor BrkB family protein [Fulvimarina sp. 2208YS6-2-32]|uniref:YihY/virulence factor BrkB family protein n=1 Tax=Fulvimarina uroteuthidis TaxID=3098149 RepID=A0ABU5I4G3_9HYPH|nr:YihY/virulence factor BrkB family protein [Fulvimarina sp. 2208YS6-2-32]MDY8110264.1 YihY/virulence factor BrkB family protein [Fulvimarina sp. 2208YS6-2-32]